MDSTLVTETSDLPLESVALRCDARAGVARVVLEQRFANPHREAMHVVYKLPLPADAAVSGFRFRIGDRTIEGTIDKRARARERFEEALASGKTAALLEEERSSLFVQEIGNVPPGAEVVCEIEMDQKLRWLDEGRWEWRFPLTAAPRYLGKPGRVSDASAVALAVAEQLSVRATIAMHLRDEIVPGSLPESPGDRVPLDRDVVVRWAVALDAQGTTVDVAGPRLAPHARLKDAHALLTIVPPRKDAIATPVSRDLTLLLDTSGSMGGEPLAQAKRIALALIDSLGERDRFEMIEFSSSPRRFRGKMLAADAAGKHAATDWIRALRASGGTEMREGILEALRPRGDRKRDDAIAQVVLVTDGLIGFEQEIVREILGLLPGDARLHTIGVGSAVNRSLTAPAARAGRGIEIVLGLGEDPERAANRLLARSVAPVVTEIDAFGGALLELAPAKLPDLFAGAPVLLSARVRPEGGEIVLRGKTANGVWEERVRVPSTAAGEGSDAVVALFGRECVEDAEMRVAGGLSPKTGDAIVESLGLAYRIATRLTSWIAVDGSAEGETSRTGNDSRPSVDPRDPSRRVEMPQALPYGTSVESFGLRAASPPMPMLAGAAPAVRSMPRPGAPAPVLQRPRRAAAYEPPDEADDLGETAPPPPPRRTPTPKRPSFVERVRGAFTGAPKAVPAWIARVVLAKPGQVVLEIAVDGGALAWKTGPRALANVAGRTIEVAVDASRTTRDGTYEPGTTVRLVLQVPPDFDASQLTEISLASIQLTVHA